MKDKMPDIRKKYERLAEKHKANRKTGLVDMKRHDRISKSEARDMVKAHKEGLRPPAIASIFDRVPRSVAKVIAKAAEIGEVTAIRPEPTWFRPLASRLRNLLYIPHPAAFFSTMRVKGEHYMSDRYGNIPAPFYWDTGQDGAIRVRLYEPETDSFIENDEYFELLLKVKPIVKTLLDQYKKHGKEYISGAIDLLSSITNDAKTMVVELTKEKVDDDEQISKFMREQPLAGEITLWYLKEGESGFLTLKVTFFTTIYRAVIQNVGDVGGYENPPRDKYISSTDKGTSILSYSHKQLAECPAKDRQSIINIHKALIEKYTSERSQLVKAVLESSKKIYDIRTKLLLEL